MIEPETSKPSVLIVDDEAGPRNSLRIILRPFFHVHTVDNAQAALRLLKERAHEIDLVTLDLKLPDRSGVELLHEIKLEHNELEVIIITGYGSLKSAMDGLRYGAAGYLLKPFNVTELVDLIKQTLAKKQRLDRVRRHLSKQEIGLRNVEPDLADAWSQFGLDYAGAPSTPPHDVKFGQYLRVAGFLSNVLEATNRELFNHSHRTSLYSARLGDQLRLSDTEVTSLRLGALLHDIGMIGLVGGPLGKAGQGGDTLPEDIQRHTNLGVRMIRPFELPAEVGQIIGYHHERFDGAGHPEGLQGEGIPLPARIVSIAQEFDQIVSGHALHAVGPIDEAMKQLRTDAGTRFDPKLLELFANAVSEDVAPSSAFAPAQRRAAITEP